MFLGANIFGAQFGAYSFKNYVPIIAAMIVAGVVGEIAHNAKMRRQKRDQARRISRLRQLVRKQKVRRDMALLDAEKQEREALERREAARRRLYRSGRIDRQWRMQRRNRETDLAGPRERFENDFDPYAYFEVLAERRRASLSSNSEPLQPAAVQVPSDSRPERQVPQPAEAKSSDEDEKHPRDGKSPSTGLA